MIELGQHVGRYRILEQIGQGGMSVVYKGLDTALDREVAIKVLHPHLATKEESRRRLAREAKAVAKLHHPNILEVFDYSGPDAGVAYLVTEYIRGHTLRDYAALQSMQPPELGAMVVQQLATALAHAHESGVIHRDLKPENVMVRDDGVLKLMDFGIAKLLDRDERMTQTGALVGSPAHMAPEIIEGQEAGPGADIFSLGTILYWLATGALPFSALNTTAMLKKILDVDFEDPRARNAAVSDGLCEIITRCLARQPEDRYPNAGELSQALTSHLGSLTLTHPAEELEAFFADPQSYRPQLVTRLRALHLDEARRWVREGRTARGLSVLNQVLALCANDPEALELVAQLNRRQRRRRRVKRALFLAGALGALSAVAWTGWRVQSHRRALESARIAAAARLVPSTSAGLRLPAVMPVGVTTPAPALERGRGLPLLERPVPSRPPGVSKRALKKEAVQVAAANPVAAPTAVGVAIEVQVRPFGFVQLDDGSRSPQALTLHTLRAAPGRHRVTVSCEYCETTQETIDVTAEGTNVFPLPAILKPAELRFDYEPPDATVVIGTERRSAAQSLKEPFEIRSARGARSFQHFVEYDIHREGFITEHRRTQVAPGSSTVVHGKLARP